MAPARRLPTVTACSTSCTQQEDWKLPIHHAGKSELFTTSISSSPQTAWYQLNRPPHSPSYLAQAVLQLVGWGIGKALVDLEHVTT